MKKPIVLKDLINECICEENAAAEEAVLQKENTLGGVVGGGLAGYITGWFASKKKEKPISQAEVATAAANYQEAVSDLKKTLDKYAGDTPEEQVNDFVSKLSTISLTHLKKQPKKFKYKK